LAVSGVQSPAKLGFPWANTPAVHRTTAAGRDASAATGNWPSLGLHGAMLPLLLIPGGIMLSATQVLDVLTIPLGFALMAAPAGMAVYYLLWKHLVGFLNAELGLA
jgi:hypothetical protein